MSQIGSDGSQPGFLGADTVSRKYLRAVFNAVSAGFVTQNDLFSREVYAKMRVAEGIRLYHEKVNKELDFLTFIYNAVNSVIAGAGSYTPESRKESNKKFYESYVKAFDSIIGVKREAKESVSDEAQNLIDTYKYLFS